MKFIHPSYKTITEFYDTWSLPHAVQLLSSAILSANDEKVWKQGSPATLLYFFERLEELLVAIFELPEDLYSDEAKPELNDQHWRLTGYASYCGWPKKYSPWDYFPRHLTQKEFLNPWKAIRKIKRWQGIDEWKLQLKELLHDALSPKTIHDLMNGEQALNGWLLLHKLLEATHLIEVRAIHEDEDGPRPKWRDPEASDAITKEQNEKEDEASKAWTVIREYALFFGDEGTTHELWEMLKRALTNKKDETSAHDRSNMIFLYEELDKLVKSVIILHHLRETKNKTIAHA